MKTLKISFLSFVLAFFAFTASAQTTSDKIKVAGECGMCKNKIEKAAKGAGASYANWDVESKVLTVKYNSTASNSAKIQKAIAAIGYDTETAKATDEAYNKLHSCCKYERTTSDNAKAACCNDAKCAECCKDGKCKEGADCCKDGKCAKADDCCTEGKCEHKSDAAHAAKRGGTSCCKKS